MATTSTSKFAIPSETSSLLQEVQPGDLRSDAQLFDSLSKHKPITSEKNVWAFWDKGIRHMPSWCQRNVFGWIRICSRGDKPWTVRVLDAIPDSPNYALNFVPKEMLPESFVAGDMVGPYVGPHSADFLRGALLYQHGGVFMDVGNILFRHPDHIGWNELEDPASPYQIAVPIMYEQVLANHFVMARKGDPFIKHWHDLFVHLWKGRKDHKGIITNPLLAFATTLDFSASRASDFHWEFKVEPITVFEYISQVLAWMRVCMLEEPGSGFNGAAYWQKHVFCFDSLRECWGAERMIGFDGKELYAALSCRLDADPESEEYKKSYNLVWRLLTESSLQKISHGKHLTKGDNLGVLWDENEDKDIEPGTFADLLRYGSTHFEQTRMKIARFPAAPAKETLRKGLFEA